MAVYPLEMGVGQKMHVPPPPPPPQRIGYDPFDVIFYTEFVNGSHPQQKVFFCLLACQFI